MDSDGFECMIHVGMGPMHDFALARFWRDARAERIRDDTSEIQRHIIGYGPWPAPAG